MFSSSTNHRNKLGVSKNSWLKMKKKDQSILEVVLHFLVSITKTLHLEDI